MEWSKTNKRIVHDIFDQEGPVAFNQVRPGMYQPICPFCAQNQGYPIRAKKIGDMYWKMYDKIRDHVLGSPCGAKTFDDIAVCLKDGTIGHLQDLYFPKDKPS